jgi:DNA polymerase I-like protein with 3'-5' exonuclease and polymerase domains
LTEKIDVKYEVYSTLFSIRKTLAQIERDYEVISLDIETRSIYTKAQRVIAKALLERDGLSIEETNEYARILHSNGLSHPSIVQTTHIILGLDIDRSIIFVVDERTEAYVFNWLVNTSMKIIIHNASFDLKVVHHRTGRFPKNFVDTQQLAKTLTNDCNNYYSRTGLKLLVGEHYPPKWSIKEETDYEVENLKDKDFLSYCAIDGAGTMLLHSILQETIKEKDRR